MHLKCLLLLGVAKQVFMEGQARPDGAEGLSILVKNADRPSPLTRLACPYREGLSKGAGGVKKGRCTHFYLRPLLPPDSQILAF